jgi:ArsR family transcriptional regulator
MDCETLLDLLGNENRRKILQLLASRPCYVSEISEKLKVAPKAVISHLSLLQEAGVIEYFIDENRRKYFHISENFHLEINLSPFLFEAYETDEERLSDENIRALFDKMDFSPAGFSDLILMLKRLRNLHKELSTAQRQLQKMITEVFGYCVEEIDSITRDAVEAEILLLLAKDVRNADEIAEELSLSGEELNFHLRNLMRYGIIKMKGKKIVIEK